MPFYQDYQKKNSHSSKMDWEDDRPRDRKRSRGENERGDKPDRDGYRIYSRPKTDGRTGDRNRSDSRNQRGYQKADPARRSAPARMQSHQDVQARKPATEATQAPRTRKPADAPRPGFETPYTREPENLLSGRNPIREALKADRDIEKMLVAKGDLSGSAREIVAMARERGIPVQVVERARLDEITPHHQGILAYASAYQYSEVDDILALAKERNEQPFIVVLDGITDPHNLGAIIRTAACAGAHGVIVPLRRSVGLTPAAVKASAGAVETVKVARVTNLTQTLRKLKQEGLWIYAADMSGEDYRTLRIEMPMALVIGSEGEGISRLVLENADFCVKLPVLGAVDSLNASVAAGILMYHAAFAAKK